MSTCATFLVGFLCGAFAAAIGWVLRRCEADRPLDRPTRRRERHRCRQLWAVQFVDHVPSATGPEVDA